MIVRERDILADEKTFVENFLKALKNNDIIYFFNSLCKESQGFLKGVAAAVGMEELYVAEVCMKDIINRCNLIYKHDEITKVCVTDDCKFVRIQDTLIFLVTENGEHQVDYLKDLEAHESNTKIH